MSIPVAQQAVFVGDAADGSQLQPISLSPPYGSDLSPFSSYLSGSPETIKKLVVPFSTLLTSEEKVVLIYDSASTSNPNKLATAMTASLDKYELTQIRGPAVFLFPHPGKDLSILVFKAMHNVITDDLDIIVVNNREGGPMRGNTQADKDLRFGMLVNIYRGQCRAREVGNFEEPGVPLTPVYDSTGQKVAGLEEIAAGLFSAQSRARANAGLPTRPQNTYSDVKFCGKCFTALENPMKCSTCKSVYYCSQECQKADWKLHKKACAPEGYTESKGRLEIG